MKFINKVMLGLAVVGLGTSTISPVVEVAAQSEVDNSNVVYRNTTQSLRVQAYINTDRPSDWNEYASNKEREFKFRIYFEGHQTDGGVHVPVGGYWNIGGNYSSAHGGLNVSGAAFYKPGTYTFRIEQDPNILGAEKYIFDLEPKYLTVEVTADDRNQLSAYIENDTVEFFNRLDFNAQPIEPEEDIYDEVITTEEVEIPYETVYEDNPELDLGIEDLAQEGSVGLKEVTTTQSTLNGEANGAPTVTEEVIVEPVSEVIYIGTREESSEESSVEEESTPDESSSEEVSSEESSVEEESTPDESSSEEVSSEESTSEDSSNSDESKNNNEPNDETNKGVTAPDFNPVYEGDTNISGMAQSNINVQVTFPSGSEGIITLVSTNDQGEFNVEVPGIVSVVEGQIITAQAINSAEDTSEIVSTTVLAKDPATTVPNVNDDSKDKKDNKDNKDIKPNKPLLPNTGESATWLTVGLGVLALGAGLVLVGKRRKSETK